MVKNIIFGLNNVLIKTYRYSVFEIESIKSKPYWHKLLIVHLCPELVNIIFPGNYNNNFLTHFIIDEYLYIIFYRHKINYLFNLLSHNHKLILYTSFNELFVTNVVTALNKLLGFNPFCKIFHKNFSIDNITLLKFMDINTNNTIIVDINNNFFNNYYIYQIKNYEHKYKQNNLFRSCIPIFDYKTLLNDDEFDIAINHIINYNF